MPLLTVEDVARSLGVTLETDDEEAGIRAGIDAVEAKIATYLGAPVTPTTVTVTVGAGESVPGILARYHPVIGYEVGMTSSWQPTLVITYGWDDPELTRAATVVAGWLVREHPSVISVWRAEQEKAGHATSRVRSSSVEGQGVTYDHLGPNGVSESARFAAQVTAPTTPALSDLDRWRVAGRRSYRRETYGSDPLGTGWW